MDKKCERKIVYLDYMERGKKIKNGGFCRWDINGDYCKVLLHVQGLYATDTISGEVQIKSRGISYPVGVIPLQCGRGEYSTVWNTNDLGESKVQYFDCESIIVRLSENRLLRGVLREPFKDIEDVQDNQVILEESKAEIQEIEENKIFENLEEEKIQKIPEIMEDEIKTEHSEVIVNDEKPTLSEIVKEEHATLPDTKISESVPTISDVPFSLSGDKWQQLRKQFTGVTPFQDGREYLSITPRDFTILPGKYQPMVQNSFLLHGYYNYGHVVLVREKDRVEDKYFLGVPGVYYDREKQAALMFGFESFESGSAKTQDGGFGYYFKRVEI